jgi:hypothetical protein
MVGRLVASCGGRDTGPPQQQKLVPGCQTLIQFSIFEFQSCWSKLEGDVPILGRALLVRRPSPCAAADVRTGSASGSRLRRLWIYPLSSFELDLRDFAPPTTPPDHRRLSVNRSSQADCCHVRFFGGFREGLCKRASKHDTGQGGSKKGRKRKQLEVRSRRLVWRGRKAGKDGEACGEAHEAGSTQLSPGQAG